MADARTTNAPAWLEARGEAEALVRAIDGNSIARDGVVRGLFREENGAPR